MSDGDHSTSEGKLVDLLAAAHVLRREPELTRRFTTFLFLEERLRRPEPRPAVTAILAAAYGDPAIYWRHMVDLDPEQIKITRERFIAVHAATRYGEVRHLGRILATPAVQAILGDDGKPWRERLRMLMTDPDYGYLIGPDLCGYLTDKPPLPRDVTDDEPPWLRDLTGEPPETPRYRYEDQGYPKATRRQIEDVVAEIARKKPQGELRAHVRYWARPILRWRFKADTTTAEIEGLARRETRPVTRNPI